MTWEEFRALSINFGQGDPGPGDSLYRIGIIPAVIRAREGRVLDTNFVYADGWGQFYCPFCKNSRLRAKRAKPGQGKAV